MRKPRVLFFITEDWYFWVHRLSLARAVRDAGCEVIVATAVGNSEARNKVLGNLQEKIIAEGFQFHPLRLVRKSINPLAEFVTLADLVSLYRKTRPDLVHQVAIKPILYGSLAAKMAGVPAIVNAIAGLGYVFIPGSWKKNLLRRGVEWAYRFCLLGDRVKVIFQNPDDRGLFLDHRILKDSQAVLIFGSGVDTERFAPTPEPEGEPIILLASRMLWDKGIGELVAASKILKERNVPGKIVLAGVPDTSNPATITESQLLAWQQQGLLEWVGYQADIPGLLARSHIACLPSYREGVPKGLLEAASCARPIVSTDVPGCREIVRHEWNGLLVPAKESLSLADALQKMITDSKMRKQMGARGRELVLERFSKEIVIRETFAVYKILLGDLWPA